eukprot:16450660-Heterocapsa_arctica.AAC.1
MGADAIPFETEGKLREVKKQTQELFDRARAEHDPELSKRYLRDSRAKGREHRKLLRLATHAQWESVISRLEKADATGDKGTLYKELWNLKLYGAPAAQRVRFSPGELRDHFAAVGAEVNETDSAAWEGLEPPMQERPEMDCVPEESEIWGNLGAMRESAPGPDGVTVSMLRYGGDKLKEYVVGMVKRMWVTDPDDWEVSLHDADVIALHKKGDRWALDNYRGICLLQIVSRLIARIASRRLSRHLETEGILAEEQWGFRPYRSAIDALFVMSRVMADAAQNEDVDPVILDMMDIQKAYPNCSRNAMDQALRMVGVPSRLRTLFAKLDSGTRYRCRAQTGKSEPYTTERGTREGCPAAPVKFNVLHHFATMYIRQKCAQEPGAKVEVATYSEEHVWPGGRWGGRRKVLGLEGTRDPVGRQPLDVVGYADDTTLVGRESTVEVRRESATQGYADWGHRVHPGKWQRLWSGTGELPGKEGEFVEHAKVLGCFLEADGGYEREVGNRISKSSIVYAKLIKRMDIARLENKTKGR